MGVNIIAGSMNILLLDDEKARYNWLIDNFPSAEVVWVTTPMQFAAKLPTMAWDLIILDHDLGLGRPGGYNAEALDGKMAARMVRKDDLVLVWSMNVDEAKKMLDIASRRGANVGYINYAYRTDPDPNRGLSVRDYLTIVEEDAIFRRHEREREAATAASERDSNA